jgi:TonB-dependent starch-binding outer membrane protein SusC
MKTTYFCRDGRKPIIFSFSRTFLIGFVVAGVLHIPVLASPSPTPPDALKIERVTGETDRDLGRHGLVGDLKVSGKITDQAGAPVPGVNILVKGTSTGTTSDVSGNYTLRVADESAVLVFSFVGYLSQELAVGSRSTIDVVMAEDTRALEEVVVIGYGTVKKSDLTASVSTVGAKDIKAFPVPSVDQALSSRAAGVVVTQASGAPGGAVTVRVRGANSIQAGSEPLYVIDGVPVYSDNDAFSSGGNRVSSNALASINPSDIESVEVLKDASGTAIYGSRGSNGVVLITTRRGKAGSTKIDYEGSHSFQAPAKYLDMLNATEYAQYQNLRAISRGQSAPFANPAQFGQGVNWQRETMRTGSIMNHQLSFTGGNERTTFAVMGGYFKNNGIVKNTDFERYSLRVNLDSRFLNDKLRLGVSSMISRTGTNAVPTDRGGPGGAIITILGQSPIGPVFNPDGSYKFEPYDGRFLTNPLAEVQEVIDRDQGTRVLGNFYLQYQITNHLSFKTSLGLDLVSNNRETYYSDQTRLGRERSRSYELGYRNITNILNENTLNYSRSFGQHRVDALAGYTYQTDNNRFGAFQSNGFSFNDFSINNIQNGVQPQIPNSGKRQWVLQSMLARVNYSLMNRYLFTVTMRRDGSSRFGETNKWAAFPSVAFAWKISEEGFMKNVTQITDAKFRMSYGVTGNSEIPVGQSLASLSTSQYLLNDNVVPTVAQNRVSNPNLRWESTAMFNAGIDFGILDDKVTFTMDYFINQTRNLLLNVALPPSTGFGTALQNAGTLENRGFEFATNLVALDKKDFRWDISANASFLRNKVTDLAGTPPFYSYVGSHLGPEGSYVAVGQPLGGWFGYDYIGLWQNADEIARNPSIAGIDKPGYPRYRDVNGDGTIDIGDRTLLGDPNPRVILGLNTTLRYKGFDLNIFVRGAYGQKIRNLQASEHADGVGNYNQYRAVLDSWTPQNPGASRPIIDATREFPSFFRRSSFFIENGSFTRLQNLSIGYTLPSVKFVRSARVYASGQNLLVWTKYTGYDPEVSNGGQSALNRGDDYDAYPRPRTFTFGVQLGF